MDEINTGRAAGEWRISAKLQSDCDPSLRHSKDKLPEIIQVWTLMRLEYEEPVPSKINLDIIETLPGGEDTGKFVLTGDSAFSVAATRAMLRQLSAIFAEILGLHSVECFVAGERMQIDRSSSVR